MSCASLPFMLNVSAAALSEAVSFAHKISNSDSGFTKTKRPFTDGITNCRPSRLDLLLEIPFKVAIVS